MDVKKGIPASRRRRRRSILPFILFVSVVPWLMPIAGCKKPEPVVLYFYCGEVFRELMHEETVAFQQVYGVRVVLLPILPVKDKDFTESENASTSRRSPAPWRSRPKIRTAFDPSEVVLAPEVSHLISTLNEDGRGDLYLTDSDLQIESLKDSALVSHQYPFCYLSMVLLVAKDNPLKIESVKTVFEKRLRLGIMNPSRDGMGLTALKIISGATPDLSDEVREALVRSFGRPDELLDALESGDVDAILVWNSFGTDSYLLRKYAMEYADRFKSRIDHAKNRNDVETLGAVLKEMYETLFAEKRFTAMIDLAKNENGKERQTLEISLISLSTSIRDGYNRRFADFLISPEGRKIMQKYGFVPK